MDSSQSKVMSKTSREKPSRPCGHLEAAGITRGASSTDNLHGQRSSHACHCYALLARPHKLAQFFCLEDGSLTDDVMTDLNAAAKLAEEGPAGRPGSRAKVQVKRAVAYRRSSWCSNNNTACCPWAQLIGHDSYCVELKKERSEDLHSACK